MHCGLKQCLREKKIDNFILISGAEPSLAEAATLAEQQSSAAAAAAAASSSESEGESNETNNSVHTACSSSNDPSKVNETRPRIHFVKEHAVVYTHHKRSQMIGSPNFTSIAGCPLHGFI